MSQQTRHHVTKDHGAKWTGTISHNDSYRIHARFLYSEYIR